MDTIQEVSILGWNLPLELMHKFIFKKLTTSDMLSLIISLR